MSRRLALSAAAYAAIAGSFLVVDRLFPVESFDVATGAGCPVGSTAPRHDASLARVFVPVDAAGRERLDADIRSRDAA